jgi:CheY-like chemotaxis protein
MLACVSPEVSPLRILVAEDDPAVAKLYVAYAQSRGHQVTVARDGAETLVAVAADRPDLVMLDVGMPKLDGRDVLRQLKSDPRTAGIPVLVVTAFGGDQNLRDLLLELGAEDVLEKPVDLPIAFAKAERSVRAVKRP